MAQYDLDSADGSQSVTQGTSPWVVSLASVTSGGDELATFVVQARDIAIGNLKSMISVLNAGGSSVVIKLRDLKIVNSQNTAVTGINSEFGLYRITGHSAGTSITPLPYDSSDSLNASVTARTGATITGEAATVLLHWDWSSDEWGAGALDQEGYDHAVQTVSNLLKQEKSCKPITLRAGEGITVKHVSNSTNGTFDIVLVFTQE